MLPNPTEQLHPDASRLDNRPLEDAALALAKGQQEAAGAPRRALRAISGGAEAMARSLASGGSLYYAAAGSSG